MGVHNMAAAKFAPPTKVNSRLLVPEKVSWLI